jgi:hypothetical protein
MNSEVMTMAILHIELEQDKTAYQPGETIAGTVRWQLETPPKDVVLRLLWYTQGKGDEDAGLAQEIRLENPGLSEQRSFRLNAPNGPYSFSGTLISLTWALELVVQPENHCTRSEIVVAPTAQEILLHAVPDQGIKLPFGLQSPGSIS